MIPFFRRNDIIRSLKTSEIYRCVSTTRESATFIGNESGKLVVPYPLSDKFFMNFQIHTSEADALLAKRGGNK